MNRSSEIILLMLGAIILSSCQTVHEISSQGGAEVVETDVVETDVIENNAQLMVRDFLIINRRENPLYNYYSYLIITENSASNYDKRLSASEAFMCEFSDVSKAMKMGLTADELAVFYAPINPGSDTNQLKLSKSGEQLLGVYNYDYSRVIANTIKRFKPSSNLSIAIVSYPLPLGFAEGGMNHLSSNALDIIELSGTPPAQIRKTIERFRRSVTGNIEVIEVSVAKKVDPKTGAVLESQIIKVPVLEYISDKDWAEKMRVVFASLGAFIESFTRVAQASVSLCK